MYLNDGMNVVNSTIANNHVKSPATTSGYGGFGGGVYANDLIAFHERHASAGNTAGSGRRGWRLR